MDTSARERIFELRFRIVHDLLIRVYGFPEVPIKPDKTTGKRVNLGLPKF
jgi:hypothetical protein